MGKFEIIVIDVKQVKKVGHPPNPPDYKTLQVRGVPENIYKKLQTYCREEIEKYKKSVKA